MTGVTVERVLVLGAGYAGSAVLRLARERGLRAVGNVRSAARAERLAAEGFEVLRRGALDASIGEHVDEATHVVVAFPPDGVTDARVAAAPGLARAAAVTYVSSTGVYGDVRGVVDDATPTPPRPTERARKLLVAEAEYLVRGAVVLRAPGIYGPDRGLHVRILSGAHQIPGDGTRFLSRVHVDDLARFVLGASAHDRHGGSSEIYLVGDAEPARQIDVARFVAEAYGAPMPPFVPLESVPESLRADRRVDSSRARAHFGVTLAYPTYREGMAPSATGLGSHVGRA